MPQTKKVLWVDEQAAVLLRDLKAEVSELCAQPEIDLCFDFTPANNIEDGANLISRPFDALILEIVLPRNRADAAELENIRMRREELKIQLGEERLYDILSGVVSPTSSEEDLLHRFLYLGRERDKFWETLGGFKVLEKCRKDLPVIILTTRSLEHDHYLTEQFVPLGLTKFKWFEKPCDLKEVARALMDFL